MDIADIIKRCVRVLYIARKPTMPEFEKVAKVTALGMVVFGAVGLVLSIVLAEL